MVEEIAWFVGIDWASQSHQVCLPDAHGRAINYGGRTPDTGTRRQVALE